uniref:Uncharacterized protein n=1 Tax=Picea glauca TaxID=3330 RepID=A0A101LVP8_PICGL|nr:hypothetical protein ABT39_MTgene2008 [Picea glauca]
MGGSPNSPTYIIFPAQLTSTSVELYFKVVESGIDKSVRAFPILSLKSKSLYGSVGDPRANPPIYLSYRSLPHIIQCQGAPCGHTEKPYVYIYI